MTLALIGQAVAAFVATNIDDLVMLSVFFGLAVAHPDGRRRAIAAVWTGQYLGFVGILAISVLGTVGAELLPHGVVAYLGLIPVALGTRLVVIAWWWHRRRMRDAGRGGSETDGSRGGVDGVVDDEIAHEQHAIAQRVGPGGPGVASVALVTLAGGGDNVSLYIPLFASVGVGGTVGCIAVFLPLVAVWCAATMFLATRPPVTRAIVRWGIVVLPLVLVLIGLRILLAGGAFGL